MSAENTLTPKSEPEAVEVASENGPVERLLFSRRMLLSPFLYKIYETPEDQETLLEWKAKIDEMIENTHKALRGEPNLLGQPDKMQLALGENPTEEDVTLFCISRFVQTHRKNAKQFQIASLAKILPGGTHTVTELGKNFDTCADTAVVTQVLAEMYGIKGSVKRPGWLLHFHWQKENNGPIIDTFWVQDRYGYLKDPKMFDEVTIKQP